MLKICVKVYIIIAWCGTWRVNWDYSLNWMFWLVTFNLCFRQLLGYCLLISNRKSCISLSPPISASAKCVSGTTICKHLSLIALLVVYTGSTTSMPLKWHLIAHPITKPWTRTCTLIILQRETRSFLSKHSMKGLSHWTLLQILAFIPTMIHPLGSARHPTEARFLRNVLSHTFQTLSSLLITLMVPRPVALL